MNQFRLGKFDSLRVGEFDSLAVGMRVAEPPGVAGAQGGKVPSFASLSIAINRQHSPTNDIQTFRRETLALLATPLPKF